MAFPNEDKTLNGKDGADITDKQSRQKATYTTWIFDTSHWGIDEGVSRPYFSFATVTIAVTGVTVSPNKALVRKGGSINLQETVLPADATDKSVTWLSDNNDVAEVDQTGKVVGTGKGTCTIIVTTNDGGFEAEAIITVEQALLGDIQLNIMALNKPATDNGFSSTQLIPFLGVTARQNSIEHSGRGRKRYNLKCWATQSDYNTLRDYNEIQERKSVYLPDGIEMECLIEKISASNELGNNKVWFNMVLLEV